MHLPVIASSPLLQVAVIAVVFFALAKWGHAPIWELLLTTALAVAAYRVTTGPDLGQILSQFHH